MQQFLSQVTGEFDIDAGQARQATGGLLRLLQDKADGKDFTQLLGQLPGASELLAEAPPQAEAAESGGGLAGLARRASSVLGGRSGGALGALSSLSAAGLDLNDIPPFASRFLDFAKGHVDEGTLQAVLRRVPELQKLL